MARYEVARGAGGSVVAEYLADQTVVKCRDESGNAVWVPASEVLPVQPSVPRGTPKYDPRRQGAEPFALGAWLGLAVGIGIMFAVSGAQSLPPWTTTEIVIFALIGGIVGQIAQVRRIKAWDQHVASHKGLVLEDASIVRRLEAPPSLADYLMLGPLVLLRSRGRRR